MYRFKLTSFVVFSSVFWTVSVGSAGLTWFLLNWVLHAKKTIKDEPDVHDDSSRLIKDEPEDSGSSSEPKVKREAPESSLLQSYPPADDESGRGSGMESAGERGVQRRRSHLTAQSH